MIESDTKPEDSGGGDTGTAQVKSEDVCKTESVDDADEGDDHDDEADKSFDPIEERRRSRSRCYRITEIDLGSVIIV